MSTVKITQSIKKAGGPSNQTFFSTLTPTGLIAHIQQNWSSCKSMQFLHCKYLLSRQTRVLRFTKKSSVLWPLHCMGKTTAQFFTPLWNALKQGGKKANFFQAWILYALEFKSSAGLLLGRRRHRWPRTHWRSYEHSWVSLKYRDGNEATSAGGRHFPKQQLLLLLAVLHDSD